MPGPRNASPHRRKTVNGENGGRRAATECAFQRARHSRMIGLVKIRETPRKLRRALKRIDIAICRNDRTIRQLHHQRRIVGPAIEINQQPRKPRQHSRTIKLVRQAPRNRTSPDVISDMPRKLARIEPERPIASRQCVRCVIADDKEARIASWIDKLEGAISFA